MIMKLGTALQAMTVVTEHDRLVWDNAPALHQQLVPLQEESQGSQQGEGHCNN